ncbi:FAD-binding and (Fe-S)-binding domain-containing protein [Natronorubrum sp. A-ect3]|uniref:FAD-binding and (Fe-S)-binding domain-containing protein n=1 Tax=Natronorubrum sp. A-ect3 TaxID=3242698 RepID=UPI00359EE2EB
MGVTTNDPRVPIPLEDVLEGEVDFGEPTRTLYATDASIYEVKPAGVVFPAGQEDVRTVVEYAREHGVSITPRGAGSSLTGNAVGEGIVLDCERYLDEIVSVDSEAETVTVQPGVVLDQLNDRVADDGLYFPPDPSTSSTCTIGGMVANDAAGAHSVRHGTTRDNVRSVECVLADGTVASFEHLKGDRLETVCGRENRLGELARTLRSIGRDHAEEIDERYPDVERNSSGYDLDESVAPDGSWLDLSKLIVGSEGTLGVITEVTLELTELPEQQAAALVFYEDVIEAAAAVESTLEADPSAVELVDADVLGYARDAWGFDLVPADAGAALLLEVEGDAVGIEDALETALEGAETEATLGVERALSAEKQETLWKIRKASNPLLNRRPGDEQAPSFIEDAAVPPEQLPAYLKRVREILIEYELDASVFGHAGQGVLHVKPFLNLKTERDRKRLQAVSEAVHDVVLDLGGCVSGEHGDGRLRSAYLEAMYGETLYAAFCELKRAADPDDVFNPAKVVPDSEGRLAGVADGLRFGGYDPDAIETALDFDDEGGLGSLIEQCNGCSKCRTTDSGVMCPSYRAEETEVTSTRGRANALRAAIDGRLDEDAITSDWFTEDVLDLCLACKACETECPTGVDMAKLKTELKHQKHQQDGIPLRSRLFANVRALNRLGSALAPISNRLASIGAGRAVLERVVGIDQRRELPTFASESFLEWVDGHDPHPDAGERGRVVLFPDCYMAYNHPAVGRAAVQVLEGCGYAVSVPDVSCCGRPALSQGMVDHAREDAADNAKILADDTQKDVPVLSGEPSCVSALREYDDILENAAGVPNAATSVSAFLLEEVGDDLVELTSPEGTDHVAVHTHCHSTAKGFDRAPVALLERAGYDVDVVDATCCGMAGAFGYESEHYDLSRSLGEDLNTKIDVLEPDVVATTGASCSQQLADLECETVHPLVLLAEVIE